MGCIKSLIKKAILSFLYARKLGGIGENVVLPFSLKLHGPQNIKINNNVIIGTNCWLAAVPLTNFEKCELVFNENAVIGDYNHIYATGSIVIEKYALTANYVYITDNLHCYDDISTPITLQPIKQLKPVIIGEGCWIGEHVSIIGASIGRNSVVGANSVVTHDIPDYCVAVGAPAKVIKRYDFEQNKWVRV